MVRDKADPKNSGTFYKFVIQDILLFGSDTCVVNPRIGWNLRVFHHSVARSLAIIQLKQGTTGWWEYPPLEAAMMAVGLE